MKKITLSFSILAVSAMFFIGCKKKVTPEAPVADTELQSSIDVSYALFSFLDAEQIGSFISDNSDPKFYYPAAGATGTVFPVADTSFPTISFGFNQTACLDGRFRDGTVNVIRVVDRTLNPLANANSRYYRSVGYSERLALLGYVVDGWRIVTVNADGIEDGQNVIVTNALTSDNYSPATTNLSWNIRGNFKMKKGNDSMFCKIDLLKTLVNSSTPSVFAVNKASSINWPKATVSYSGKASGTTVNGAKFTLEVGTDNPIKRDFTCTPNIVTSVATTATVGVVSQKSSEYHPFINGIASFTTAALYPRQIYYGGSETDAQGQCDNSGAILIKGISYPVDFRTQ